MTVIPDPNKEGVDKDSLTVTPDPNEEGETEGANVEEGETDGANVGIVDGQQGRNGNNSDDLHKTTLNEDNKMFFFVKEEKDH